MTAIKCELVNIDSHQSDNVLVKAEKEHLSFTGS